MCFLCEEPFRTIFIALAAIGAVSLLRLGQKAIKRLWVARVERA